MNSNLCKETFTHNKVTYYKNIKYFCEVQTYLKTELGILRVYNYSNESCYLFIDDFYKYFYSDIELRKVKLEKIRNEKM